jgi:hypothetical protein
VYKYSASEVSTVASDGIQRSNGDFALMALPPPKRRVRQRRPTPANSRLLSTYFGVSRQTDGMPVDGAPIQHRRKDEKKTSN